MTPSERDELRALRRRHLERVLGLKAGIIIANDIQTRELAQRGGFRGPTPHGRETV